MEQVLGSTWQPHTSHLARHRNQVKLFSPSGVTVFSRLELCPLVRSCEAWQSHVQAGQSLLAFLKVGAPLSPPLPHSPSVGRAEGTVRCTLRMVERVLKGHGLPCCPSRPCRYRKHRADRAASASTEENDTARCP